MNLKNVHSIDFKLLDNEAIQVTIDDSHLWEFVELSYIPEPFRIIVKEIFESFDDQKFSLIVEGKR